MCSPTNIFSPSVLKKLSVLKTIWPMNSQSGPARKFCHLVSKLLVLGAQTFWRVWFGARKMYKYLTNPEHFHGQKSLYPYPVFTVAGSVSFSCWKILFCDGHCRHCWAHTTAPQPAVNPAPYMFTGVASGITSIPVSSTRWLSWCPLRGLHRARLPDTSGSVEGPGSRFMKKHKY